MIWKVILCVVSFALPLFVIIYFVGFLNGADKKEEKESFTWLKKWLYERRKNKYRFLIALYATDEAESLLFLKRAKNIEQAKEKAHCLVGVKDGRYKAVVFRINPITGRVLYIEYVT